MKIKFDRKNALNKFGLRILKLLNQDHLAFFVGGSVRNMILNHPYDNLDIATSAKPDEVESIFLRSGIKTRPVGKQFGTILAVSDAGKVEITTFRKEGRYEDKRHPSHVVFTENLELDAARRDLTVNALYFNPEKPALLDPTQGIKDLRAKIIRFVGDPKKRIDEDSLRMLRAVRIATQLRFKIEKNSFAAIKTRAKFIQYVSGERIKAEFDKILLSKNPDLGIDLLDKTGMLKFIIPEVESIKRFYHKSKKYHLEGSMYDHTLLALKYARGQDLPLLYALLFHDIGKPQKAKKVLKQEGWVISTKGHADVGAEIFLKFAKKLKFSRSETKMIHWLVEKHMIMTDFWNMRLSKQLAIARNIAFPLLMKHWHYDEMATKRAARIDDFHKKCLKSLRAGKKIIHQLRLTKNLAKNLVDGDKIMKVLKLSPGPKVGQILNQAREKIITGEIKNKTGLNTFLKKFVRRS